MALGLLRSLMPRDERFVNRLCRHAELVAAGAVEFRGLLAGGDVDRHFKELFRLEEAADDVTRETIRATHRSFVTPFDRAQILALTTALDDTIDLMKEGSRRIGLYAVPYTLEMLAIADCALLAASELRDAMPLLNAIGRNVAKLNEMQRKVHQAESDADELFDKGLRNLFASEASLGHKLAVEKVYELIEDVVDRCEDVADVIAGIVVEQV